MSGPLPYLQAPAYRERQGTSIGGGLLKHIAADLGLDIDRETDLIAVAQYHENKHKGRDEINRAILEEFTKEAKLTENHRLIANLPIDTVWTTNYDDLLEQAFKAANKRVDAKITSENLPLVKPGRSVAIYKMHGDISLPHEAVITKEDYETYDVRRELFSIKLKGDLVGRTFLFLGFSFTDPNIEYVLSRIRALLGKNKGTHYCIMRRPEKKKGMKGKALATHEYEAAKLALRVADLERYGIRPLMVNSFGEITEILGEVNRRCHLRDVFLSGSVSDFAPLGEDRIKDLSRQIGKRLISSGCNLVSGVGLGIGGYTIIGALEALHTNDQGDHDDRISLRPFPQEAPAGVSLASMWTKYRNDMIGKSGAVIFLAGNKRVKGKTVIANGMLEEFEIAKLLGKYPIPIGASGHAARKIWKSVSANLSNFFPKGGVTKHFQVLGDASKSNQELLDAAFDVLKHIKAF